MNRIGTLMLFAICVVQGTPLKYCYSGKVNDYSSYETYANNPLNITMEILSNEEIRTFEILDHNVPSKYIVNYEVILQNLTIGETDLISAPILGEVKLTYGSFGYWFKINFHQEDLNLVLYSEEEYCPVYNPVPYFEVYYSPRYFSLDRDADMKGGIQFNNVQTVPEPSCYSIILLIIPFFFIGGIKYFRS